MLLKDYLVERPKTTKLQSKGNYLYVYQVTGKQYRKDKKYTVDKRVCVGRMADDNYMIPNEKFEEYYPELMINLVEPPKLSDTLKIGSFVVIQSLFVSLHIRELLDTIYEECDFIEDMVSYMLTSESSVFQYYDSFMRNRPVRSSVRSDSYICKFLKEMTEEGMKAFIGAWNLYNNDKSSVYIGYDSTNMNTNSQGIDIADYGHPKVDEDLPQINLSYAVNQTDSKPLFYELYDGSIIDNSQYSYMIELAKEYGYTNIGFLIDRGYFSKNNIISMRKNGYNYIIMLKESTEIHRKAVNEVKHKLNSMSDFYIPEHEVCGTTVEFKMFQDDENISYFHVYYDDGRAAEERRSLLNMIAQYEKELDKKIEKKIAVEGELKKYRKYFKLNYDSNGYFLSYKKNTKAIDDDLNKFGYFVIVSSEKKDAPEILDIYRSRDNIEKMFRSLKSGIDFNKFRVHTDASLKAKVFITFIAMIIRNEIFQKTISIRKENRKYYTVPSMIHELDNIEITRNSHGRYVRRYALTKKQKRILEQFDIDENRLNKEIEAINSRLI